MFLRKTEGIQDKKQGRQDAWQRKTKLNWTRYDCKGECNKNLLIAYLVATKLTTVGMMLISSLFRQLPTEFSMLNSLLSLRLCHFIIREREGEN